MAGPFERGDGMRSFMQVLGTRHEWRCMITMGKHAVVRIASGAAFTPNGPALAGCVVAVKRIGRESSG